MIGKKYSEIEIWSLASFDKCGGKGTFFMFMCACVSVLVSVGMWVCECPCVCVCGRVRVCPWEFAWVRVPLLVLSCVRACAQDE